MARRHAEVFLEVLKGEGFASRTRGRCSRTRRPAARRAALGGPPGPDLVGRATERHGRWAATLGMNLQSSTLKFDETGEPFHVQQRKQIEAYHEAWKAGGSQAHTARLGQPEHLRPGRRSRPRLLRARERGPATRSATSTADAGDLRTVLRRGAGRPGQAARRGRGDRRRGHAAPDGPQPAGRRLQRARPRVHPEVRRAGPGLAVRAR